MHDLVIRNVQIFDGKGSPPVFGDVAITGDRISAVGVVSGPAKAELDGKGKALSPGFIDVHTHDDRLVFVNPAMTPKTSQGVTTVVTGNCGISLAPMTRPDPAAPLNLLSGDASLFHPRFADYRKRLDTTPPAINVAPLVGHTALRACTMDRFDRPATDKEIDAMGALLDEALDSGAIGFSTGLAYPNAFKSTSGEVEALLAHVADKGKLYTTHMRDESGGLFEAVEEALTSSRKAGVPLVISHLKCASKEVWGLADKVLKQVEEGAKHQKVAYDAYPYDASSTVLLPEMIGPSKRVTVSWSDAHPEQAGHDLDEIARCWACSMDEAARRLAPAGGIYYRMEERDVRKILAHPLGMIGSDGLPHDKHPHPRLWGTFPRILGRYVREFGAIALPEAIRKMTAWPAEVFGMKDRGLIGEGAYADITLFDPDIVLDLASFEEPTLLSAGIEKVFVNGVIAFENGASTASRTGRFVGREMH